MHRRFAVVMIVSLVFVGPSAGQESPEPQSKQPADPLDGPPFVSAKAWAIAEGRTGKLLWSSEEQTPRHIASTTKMMTAWLVLQQAEMDSKVFDQLVTISERADKTGGSSADIRLGEQYAVRDLLFGLLLPSGNDASVALAEHFGRTFLGGDQPEKPDGEESLEAFVAEMNRQAEKLGMTQTSYLDPHGLGGNRSTARDLLRLAHSAMQSAQFRSYVQTARHCCTVKIPEGEPREQVWINTNKLLDVTGYDGVKTGTTNAAGACLVSSCHRGNDHLLIVVLGATSPDGRYVDTRNLLRWAWLQRGHGSATSGGR
jgi:D-alanyl-D-alanine carboxypeptidase (penicillin-binding protein 5/6)